MRKLLAIWLGILVVVAVPIMASATTMTMTPAQLQALYETYENPAHIGTYLNPIQATTEGAKVTGNIRTSDAGWGAIQVGANFWGIPYGGSAGDEATNVALGLGSLSGYDAYALVFENVNENAWEYQLYFNVGYTDWAEDDYYVQNTWTSLDKDESGVVTLDFTNCEVWKNGAYVGLTDITTIAGVNFDHISNIGFHIGGNVPVGPYDYTFETMVTPVPEPATLLLFGSGLVGLFGIGRRKLKKS